MLFLFLRLAAGESSQPPQLTSFPLSLACSAFTRFKQSPFHPSFVNPSLLSQALYSFSAIVIFEVVEKMCEAFSKIKGFRVDGNPILDYRTEIQKELERKFDAIMESHYQDCRMGRL